MQSPIFIHANEADRQREEFRDVGHRFAGSPMPLLLLSLLLVGAVRLRKELPIQTLEIRKT